MDGALLETSPHREGTISRYGSIEATCWDCAKLNWASVALARKLGFGHEREYRLLAWFPKEG